MSEQNLNEVMVEESTENVDPIMMDENETSTEDYCEDSHGSKVGAFIGGSVVTLGTIVLYKKAIKPGYKWIKAKVTGLMSKKKEETESESTEEITEVKK